MRSFINVTIHQILMRLIKTHIMGQAEYVACITYIMDAYKITFRKPERCRLNTTSFRMYVLMNIVMIHWIS
jgi:hypothetical protein